MAQSGFTRDILKWLQGLDLSYSVKNPRRDFANGFIVAEIFSRYYPADVQMHSYDNGTSLQKKLDNWALLDRFIKKREIPLNPSLVEDTMHAKPGAAISLVESIYEFLTKKSIAKSGQGNTETTSDRTDLPSYAKPTASKAIKEGISSAELFLKPDLQYPANKASSIIDQHEKAKKEEKRHERIGYASKLNSRDFVSSDAGSVINKTQFQTVAPPIAAGGVQFREVKVRPVERTISQVRANRGNSSELASKVPSRPSSRASSAGGSVTVKQEVSSSKPGGNISGTFTILNTVGSIILNTLQGTQLKLELEKHHNVCELFVARSQSLPEHVLVNAINSLSDNTQLICSVIADNFHELPVLLTTFLPLFNLPEGYGRMFEKMGEVYIQWGSFLASGNRSFEAWQIFYIQILPRLTSVIRLHLSSRHIFLRAILSFCPSDAEHHIECINQLQLCLQDYDVFYLCLAKLALYDSVMSSPNLLNAYATHALAAIGTNSPNSKSAGLAILVLIAHQDYRFVVGMFDRLSALAQDPWWEIQSQVLIIGTKLLRGVNSGSAQCYKIYSVLHSILNDECSPLVQKIGLIYLTPILEFHPDLYKIYLLTLIMAPEHLRQELLQDDPALVSDIQPNGLVAGNYSITSLPSEWSDLGVTNALSLQILTEKLDYLEKEHVDIFLAATKHEFLEQELTAWAQILFQMKNYFYVSLCDEILCDTACAIVYRFIYNLGKLSFQTLPTLVTSLRMLFPNGSLHCQQLVVELLGHIHSIDEDVKNGLRDALTARADVLRDMQRSTYFRDFTTMIRL